MLGARIEQSSAEHQADASGSPQQVPGSTSAREGAVSEHGTADTGGLSHPGEGAAESVWKSISEAVGVAAGAGKPATEPDQAAAPAAAQPASASAHAESDSSTAAPQTAGTATAVMAVPTSGEPSAHDSGASAAASTSQQPPSQSSNGATPDADVIEHPHPPSDAPPAALVVPLAHTADGLDASKGGLQEGRAAANVEESTSACKQS